MTTILDLGGAPANEPCAQLGQTPDFSALNVLEVETYRAALQARYGAAPPGCRLVPIDNRHDFGCYRTLALAIDDAEQPDVGAYAEAVEQGLASWIEAGFTPPVVYDGIVGTARRVDLGEIIVGALATTRPASDGSFPLVEFAQLHANLALAYPSHAATFADRVAMDAPPVVAMDDPRFSDADGVRLEGEALARAVTAAAINAAAPILAAHGITKIVINYDGYGDEGQINEVQAEDADGAAIELPEVCCERYVSGHDGSVTVSVASLRSALEELGYEALAAYHSGWETDEGSFGKLTIDVERRFAVLDHNVYFTESELFTTEL